MKKTTLPNCDNCPVERVSCNDIQEFLVNLNQQTGKNYRLPTEAWGYAARACAAESSKAVVVRKAKATNMPVAIP